MSSEDAPATSQLTFDDAQSELERIVGELESGRVPLEKAIELTKRGEELYRLCRGRLDAAHGEIEELSKRVEAVRPETPHEPG